MLSRGQKRSITGEMQAVWIPGIVSHKQLIGAQATPQLQHRHSKHTHFYPHIQEGTGGHKTKKQPVFQFDHFSSIRTITRTWYSVTEEEKAFTIKSDLAD